MLILVQIDIANADLAAFEAYETAVLELLDQHGARLEERLRASDSASETHLLYFPDAAALANFSADPARIALQDLWDCTGANSTLTEMMRVV